MNTIRELLKNADPLREELPLSEQERDWRRHMVVSAASTVPMPVAARSIPAIATIAVIIVVALFAGSHIGSHGVGELQAAVRFEVRLAEENPAPALREARIVGSGRVIYLHAENILSNSDIEQAKVIPGGSPSRFSVAVEFNAAGAQKIHEATEAHLGKPVAILIDGEVVMAPMVRSAIDASAVITGDFTSAQAERIVSGIGIP